MLIFVIGAPGSGKGTLCHKLSTEFSYTHFSLGDHLRHLLRTNSDSLEQHVIAHIQKSELLPTSDLLPILQKAIQQRVEEGEEGEEEGNHDVGILLDGFPRNIEQVRVEGKVVLRPDVVLFFDCPGEIAKQRYLTRALPGRDCDVGVFERRYEEFVALNCAVLREYEQMGVLITIDTSKDTETSYTCLLRALRASDCGLCEIGGSKG